MTAPPPCVFLVGAGPGSPGLLTVRAAELLARADLIVYDQLVPRRLLDGANPAAECVAVRDLPGPPADRPPPLAPLMATAAREGKVVVRLKSGDPLTFGRGSEELDALRAAGVAYEIVPGVTAVSAAAAVLELPLARRGSGPTAGAVALIAGHDLPARGGPSPGLDWAALAKFPGTLAVYMGVARLPLIVAELLKGGMNPETPAGVVERASTGDMRSVFAPIGGLDHARRQAGLEAPGLILVGDALAGRPAQSWFERLPLFGRRVLVPRPADQAEAMLRDLERLGAVAVHLPTLAIRPPNDLAAVDAALDQLRAGAFDWVTFTSANGVHGLLKRNRTRGFDARTLGRVRLAAVGPRTAAALNEYGLTADVVPAGPFHAGALAAGLSEAVRGQRVLAARGDRGRETLLTELAKVATVAAVVVYEQADAPIDPDSDAVAALRRGEIGFVTLSSANVARNLIGAFDATIRGRIARGEVKLVAMSGEVVAAAAELGCPAVAAAEATAAGLVAAVVRLAAT